MRPAGCFTAGPDTRHSRPDARYGDPHGPPSPLFPLQAPRSRSNDAPTLAGAPSRYGNLAPESGPWRRVIDDELDELLEGLAAVAIEGLKAVGKTATALQRVRTVHRLDDPTQASLARAEPARLVGGPTPTTPPTHSGAGRIVRLRLRPLSLAERHLDTPSVSFSGLLAGGAAIGGETDVGLARYAEEIAASGFPAIRPLPARARRAQLESYIARVVDRDFDALGHPVRKPDMLRRWMAAYAAATATTATLETIRDAATVGAGSSPTRVTVNAYRDVLERLWILDPVPGWVPSRNYFSRLARPDKHHLADPVLAAVLLGVSAGSLLEGDDAGVPMPRDGTLLGHLFESLVTESVRVYAQAAEATVRHLRTKGGRHEVDLVVERADHRVVAMEVKLGRDASDGDVRHLHWLREKLGDDLIDAVVVTTGPAAYRREDGIAVVPAVLLGP